MTSHLTVLENALSIHPHFLPWHTEDYVGRASKSQEITRPKLELGNLRVEGSESKSKSEDRPLSQGEKMTWPLETSLDLSGGISTSFFSSGGRCSGPSLHVSLFALWEVCSLVHDNLTLKSYCIDYSRLDGLKCTWQKLYTTGIIWIGSWIRMEGGSFAIPSHYNDAVH